VRVCASHWRKLCTHVYVEISACTPAFGVSLFESVIHSRAGHPPSDHNLAIKCIFHRSSQAENLTRKLSQYHSRHSTSHRNISHPRNSQAEKLESKVSGELGTLRASSQAVTRQLSKQLQESQDRYIASELVVQVRERELHQRIKVEADLNRVIEQLQHTLANEEEHRERAEAALVKEQTDRSAERETQEKRHGKAIADLAASHTRATAQFEREIKQAKERIETLLAAAEKAAQARVRVGAVENEQTLSHANPQHARDPQHARARPSFPFSHTHPLALSQSNTV
jgi:hypothetical protein